MKNVSRLISKGVGAATLASVLFMMPANGAEAMAATPYESWGGEMINVEAFVGDGNVSFKWDWDETMFEEGQTEVAVWISTVDMNRIAADGWNLPESDYAVLGENVWIQDVPMDVNEWTFSGLTNGISYWFDCYGDWTPVYNGEGDEYYPALVPVASTEGESTTPENPSEGGSTTTPENPSEGGSTTTPENPSVGGNTTTPENPSEGESCAPGSVSKEKSGVEVFSESLSTISESIDKAEAGATIKIEGGDGFHALPNSIMKALYEKGNVSLEFTYDYEGVDYKIVIPAGKAVNNDIPWYGPMYLATYFGK